MDNNNVFESLAVLVILFYNFIMIDFFQKTPIFW